MSFSAENEALRQAYLRELGIQTWYPRFVLPHAGVTREYSHEENAQSEIISSDEVTAALQLIDETVQHQVGEELLAEPETAPVATSPEASASGAVPYFAFAYLSVSDKLAVICEIPYQSRGRLAASVRTLLSRILEALQVPVRSSETPVLHFQWPLHESGRLEQSMENARQTLQGFLSRQLKEKPVPYLLVFSEQWPEWLLPDNFHPADSKTMFVHPQLALQMLVTRGLHAILQDESIKRPVWEQMRELKAQLERISNHSENIERKTGEH